MGKGLITISRQFGCGGAYLGRRIARRLGIAYVDREILQQAARSFGASVSELAKREERASNFLENFLRGLAMGSPESGYVPPSIPPVYDRDLFDVEAKIIRTLADEKSAVIVGRGGFHVLKERPGLTNLFIHAPADFRIARVMEVYDIKRRQKAEALIEESDRERRKYLKNMTGADWTDSRNYHLCLDIGRTDFPTAEEIVMTLIEGVAQKSGE